jgi:hypothetical protein
MACWKCLSPPCVFNRNWPSSGGGYFRLLPYALSRWMLQRVNQHDRSPRSSTFTHGKSTSASRASPGISAKTRFRHYVNINRMETRLQALLGDFRWGRMDQIFLAEGAAPA